MRDPSLRLRAFMEPDCVTKESVRIVVRARPTRAPVDRAAIRGGGRLGARGTTREIFASDRLPRLAQHPPVPKDAAPRHSEGHAKPLGNRLERQPLGGYTAD